MPVGQSDFPLPQSGLPASQDRWPARRDRFPLQERGLRAPKRRLPFRPGAFPAPHDEKGVRLSDDCSGFLEIVGEMVDRFGLEVHAYSLMPNHYHLLVRSVAGNLSRGMQHLDGTYTLWLHKRHQWDGPAFRGRFRSQLVEDEEHLRLLVAYPDVAEATSGFARRKAIYPNETAIRSEIQEFTFCELLKMRSKLVATRW